MSTGFPFAILLLGSLMIRKSPTGGLSFLSLWPQVDEMAFAFGLGTTHPCAIAVHMEPFSTSALKDLT
jgi:hypothetical protein